ncbi:serine hydrolase [Radiobacillus kanasensis]|uniref:serine hydrolase domain-containing protein n=1 Tax=Radiobacillus kanasensis TaxID=2844358 RepID=UPI001E3FFBAB|nr:serine hydrolase domain-containing protein [Radiobacillus kanasensis]UFU00214.1 serine hydrolase [Radiobacillus kanasensis]
MKRKWAYITLLTIVTTSIFTTTDIQLEANSKDNSTIVKPEMKRVQEKAHPHFRWGTPGPTSPVLHPGSIRGAGMVAKPLKEIDSVMTEMISEDVMPGAVTFVARRGHIVQHEAYGDAVLYKNDQGEKIEDPIKMKKDTIFDVASLSKIFTSLAAMELYEQGKFELDDSVSEYIPEYAQNGKEEVTIRQLMTHTSGFKAWVPLYTIGESKQDRLDYVLQYPLDNKPGTTYTYSDLNMITLAILVERLSGMSLDEFVKERITKPLKMKDTMYNPPEKLKSRIAATEYQPWTDRGLVWGQVHDENAWSLGGVAGHAGVFSTANDLAKLGHMIINDGRYGNKQILKPETVKLLVENQIPQFPGDEHGLGWEVGQGWYMDALSGASTVGHTGYTGTSIVIDRENDTVAVLLTNRVHPTRETVSTNPARRQFARQVADAIPVNVPHKSKTWFSGYGDKANKKLVAEVNVKEESTLSFETWYRIEAGYDFGNIQISSDGETWTTVGEPYTGFSPGWTEQKIAIPSGTKFMRFSYETDSSTNGRGWYVSEPKLNNVRLDFSSDDWIIRNY